MSQLCRGQIIWVELVDPQGRNPKCRPAVVVTPDENIRDDGEVSVVAITTQLHDAPAEDQVELPWANEGHPRTKLRGRCAAVCTWMANVSVASIQSYAGKVPGKQLIEILKRIKPLEPPPGAATQPGEPPA